jgi:hypothetical protein
MSRVAPINLSQPTAFGLNKLKSLADEALVHWMQAISLNRFEAPKSFQRHQYCHMPPTARRHSGWNEHYAHTTLSFHSFIMLKSIYSLSNLPMTQAFRTPRRHSPYQVPTPNNMPQWPCSFTSTTPTDPNTTQAQQASHAVWNATMTRPCLLCHIIAKTGMTDQTWAQTRDCGGGQRGTEGIGSVGGAMGSRIG